MAAARNEDRRFLLGSGEGAEIKGVTDDAGGVEEGRDASSGWPGWSSWRFAAGGKAAERSRKAAARQALPDSVDRPFKEKRDGQGDPDDKCYRNSSLRVQRDLVKWEEWNKSTIQERGEEIIDFALKRWQVGPVADPVANANAPQS